MQTRGRRCFTKHKPHAGHQNGRKMLFCPTPWWPWPLNLTFKLVWAKDQTHLPCEFGANPFSSSQGIWYANKKVADSAKQSPIQFTACGNNAIKEQTGGPWRTSVKIKHLGDISEGRLTILLKTTHAEYMTVRVGIQSEDTFAGDVRKTTPPWRLKVIYLKRCNRQLALTTTYTWQAPAVSIDICTHTHTQW